MSTDSANATIVSESDETNSDEVTKENTESEEVNTKKTDEDGVSAKKNRWMKRKEK